jgi:hypothetical protein
MKHLSLSPASAAALALWALAVPAAAHDGDDHGSAAAGATPALPRFAASSPAFELVGVLDGKHLRLYLDHAASNAPVENATLELELGGAKLALERHASGEFEATLAAAPPAGVLAVMATVIAGDESDLLAGELDIHRDAAAATTPAWNWKSAAPWAAAGLFALLAAVLGLGRRRHHDGVRP